MLDWLTDAEIQRSLGFYGVSDVRQKSKLKLIWGMSASL